MRFDPQSGFMPDSESGTPVPGMKQITGGGGRDPEPRGRLRGSVMIVVVGVTCVMGVWMWREHVYGPQTAAAEQIVQFLPKWLKDSLNLEDGNEATTLLPVSTPDDAPAGVRINTDVSRTGGDDAPSADPSAPEKPAEPAESESPADDQPAEPQRPLLSAGPSDTGSAGDTEEKTYGVSFQPPFQAKQAYDRGVAKAYYGRFRDAIMLFEEAISIDPEFAEARYRLALAHLKLHDVEKARRQHGELVKLNSPFASQLARQLPSPELEE